MAVLKLPALRISDRGGAVGASQLATLASPHLAIAAMALSMSIFVPQYYASTTDISLAGVGLAFTVVRLADLLFDPVLGVMVDRTRSQFGRFRPWVILGAPAVMAGAWITYFPPSTAGLVYLIVGLVLFYAGHSLITVTTFAWAAVLGGDDASRSRAYGWIQTASMLGMLIVLGMLPFLKLYIPHSNDIAVHAMGLFILITIPVTVLAVSAIVVEPAGAEVSHTPPPFLSAMLDYGRLLARRRVLAIIGNTFFYALSSGVVGSLFLFFAAKKDLADQASMLLFVHFGAAFACARLWTPISQRFGKHSVLVALCGTAVVLQLGILILPQHAIAWAVFGQMIVGVTYSGMLVLQRAVLGDIANDLRDESEDATGRLYALYSFVTKIGVAGAVGLTFPAMQWIGFNPKHGAANTPSAIHHMELAFILGPALLITAAGLSVIGGDRRHSSGQLSRGARTR